MLKIKTVVSLSLFSALLGCGAQDDTQTPQDTRVIGISDNAVCQYQTDTQVQWGALQIQDAQNLSDYQLFQNQCDPTTKPNDRGVIYEMATPLFTDYASKYRYVFVPNDKTAEYTQSEVFNFPVGSVIVKTFAMPVKTNTRGIDNEELIETRLLIHRESGWVALPYIWNDDKSDAILTPVGGETRLTLEHESQEYVLDYGVPNSQQCIKCHQYKLEGEAISISPIGPKARYLNNDVDYGSSQQNQLSKWVEAGLLSGLPSELNTVEAVPVFNDSTDIDAIAPSQLDGFARGWLDINCGHCHREEGNASNTNFNAQWGFENSLETCNKPISYGGQGLSYIITPGAANESIMIQRMEAVPNGQGDQMPPLGRDLVHSEGVELIKAWVNASTATPCP